MKITDIKPYERNAKLHDKKQIELLAKIVAEVGWRQPILVNQEGVIVAGHGRYLVWQTFKDQYALKDVWAIDDKGNTVSGEAETKPLTPEQEEAYRLADNKVNAMTGFDMSIVIPILKDLSIPMFELTGFDKDLIISPDEKDDVVPEVPQETQSKLGDLYEIAEHRIMCGDSTLAENVEKLMNGKKADMVFTDPPYGVDYVGKTKDALKIKNDITTETFKNAMPNYARYTKLGASFYICCPPGNKFIDFVVPFNEYCHQSSTIIWVKNSLVLGHGDYHFKHEPILYGWNKEGVHSFYGDRSQTTVWEIDRPSRSKEHPTMKPVALVEKAIINSSKQDDIILDLFGGGGVDTRCLSKDWSSLLYSRA